MKKLTEKFGKKKVYAGIAVIIALIILLCIFFYVESTPKFNVIAKENIVTEYGEELDNSLLFDDKKSDPGIKVKEIKNFNKNKAGDQKITVTFINKDEKTKSIKIKLTVKDTVKPSFVDFKKEITIEQNAENVKLEDYFIADDKAPVTISVDGKVDLNKTGKYEIKVTAADSNGNKTDAQSCVVVVASAKDVASGTKLTATVKGEVPMSKETKSKADKGEIKVKVDKPSEQVQSVVKEQTNKKESSGSESSSSSSKPQTNDNKKNDSTSTNTNKPDNGSSNNSNGSGNASKPDKDNSSSVSSNSDKKEEPAKHEHKWEEVYKTVHHDEVGHNEKVVVKDAWDEEVPKYEYQWVNVCNNCGEITYTDDEAILHSVSHLGESEASYHAEQIKVQKGTDIVHHDAEYGNKWVVDKKAYDEKILDHYECSCGATKK